MDLNASLVLRCHFLRDYHGIRKPAQLLVDMSRAAGRVYMVGIGLVRLGRVQVAEGEIDAGIATILEGMSNFQPDVSYEYCASVLADAYLVARRPREGLTLLAEVIPMAAEHHQRLCESELYRLQGEFLLLKGDRAVAEDAMRRAVASARELEARSWELRATTSLARLLRDTNRRDEARTMLAEIYNWFTEGFDTADLKDAKALLEELN